MLSRHLDPIAAIATAPGRGAVGIVRVSGRGLSALVRTLCGRDLKAREATYLPFLDGHGQALDQGLALYFPAPHSYTGEDVLELQAHGGAVVLQLLLARCLEAGAACGLPTLRVADPGEFTQRAYLNHKIDLAQAEAIADLIDASTEAAARSAQRSLSGAFSNAIHTLRDALVHLRMLVEATLDFPEEDIDFLQQADARGQLQRLQTQLASVRGQAQQGALLREGMTVVIAGQPNAGKSSLLNALAGAELAIVTPIAGTTRDVVRQSLQIQGVPLHIVDTAGLRDSALPEVDAVEKLGIARAWEHIAQADAVLLVHDLTRQAQADYAAADAALAAQLPSGIPIVHVWNKADQAPPAWPGPPATDDNTTHLELSAKEGTGLDALRQALLRTVGWQAAPEGLFIARERHLHALAQVDEHLNQCAAWLHHPAPALDILAEELRLAQNALNSITGEFNADDLLGVIFSQFCIGK